LYTRSSQLTKFASPLKQSGFVQARVPKRTYNQVATYERGLFEKPELTPGKKLVLTSIITGSVVGLGTIYFAGQTLQYETTEMFPLVVRDRLNASYKYVAGGLAMTGVAAALAFRSPLVWRVMTAYPIAGALGMFVATIGAMIVTRSIPKEDAVAKHLSLAAFTGLVGISLFPLGLYGGAVLMNAAVATGLIVGGLSLVASAAPSESFLWMGGPLAIGIGVVCGASIAQMFFPLSGLLANVTMYGGLAVFGAFTLYDTQRMLLHAKTLARYDPINESIGVYLNTINIFVRMVQLMSGGNRRK